VPAKYRNTETGDAWTGRGRTPRWLVALEAAGRTRDEFKIA
jgi:DNA-binding protein H-NS